MVFFIDLSHIALVIISLVPWSLLDTENNTINPVIIWLFLLLTVVMQRVGPLDRLAKMLASETAWYSTVIYPQICGYKCEVWMSQSRCYSLQFVVRIESWKVLKASAENGSSHFCCRCRLSRSGLCRRRSSKASVSLWHHKQVISRMTVKRRDNWKMDFSNMWGVHWQTRDVLCLKTLVKPIIH